MRKLLYILPLLLIACSKDDTSSTTPNEDPIATLKLSVFAGDAVARELFEIDVTTNGGAVITSNLTETIGLNFEANKTYAKNNLATWYLRNNGNLDVWQKNLDTDETQFYEDLCDFTGEFQLGVDNSAQKLFYISLYQENNISGSRNRIYSQQGCVFQSFLDYRIRSLYTTGENILIFCRGISNTDSYKVFKVNPNSGLVTSEIEFDQNVRMTVRNDELHVFFANNDYKVLRMVDFSQLSSSSLELNYDDVSSGFFYTEFDGNTMVVKVTYAQPSTIANGPAIMDLSTGEILTPYGLLYDVITNFSNENGGFFNPTGAYDVSLENDLIVVGLSNGSNQHALAVTNFNAEILEIIPIDHLPSQILIR